VACGYGAFTYMQNRQMYPFKVGGIAVIRDLILLVASL
jgi:hypothetical protein